jgi:hypothetical protein
MINSACRSPTFSFLMPFSNLLLPECRLRQLDEKTPGAGVPRPTSFVTERHRRPRERARDIRLAREVSRSWTTPGRTEQVVLRFGEPPRALRVD